MKIALGCIIFSVFFLMTPCTVRAGVPSGGDSTGDSTDDLRRAVNAWKADLVNPLGEQEQPLFAAIKVGNPLAVQVLLSENSFNLVARTAEGDSCWHVLARSIIKGKESEFIHIADMLKKADCDLLVTNNEGQGVLHLAVFSGCKPLIKRLITWGVDILAKDALGRAPDHEDYDAYEVFQECLKDVVETLPRA
jgi:hypothetical protein